MNYHRLFVFVEGPDDERFFKTVLAHSFSSYHDIKYIPYANQKPKKVSNHIKTILKIPNWDFLFLHDYDDHPCITSCKQKVNERFSQALRPEDTIIVKREIESWYLAGISGENCKEFGIKLERDTEGISKEQFNQMLPKGSIRTDFMIELLKVFSSEEAKKRNSSFAYFWSKYVEVP